MNKKYLDAVADKLFTSKKTKVNFWMDVKVDAPSNLASPVFRAPILLHMQVLMAGHGIWEGHCGTATRALNRFIESQTDHPSGDNIPNFDTLES